MSDFARQSSGRMRHVHWAVVLLVAAVVLPTVCLLWLMSHAVANERLAIRQKLTDSYRFSLPDQLDTLDRKWNEFSREGEALFKESAGENSAVFIEEGFADGYLVYDAELRTRIRPKRSDEVPVSTWPPLADLFRTASQAEFGRADYTAAINEYRRIAALYPADSETRLRAEAAAIRCLKKAGRLDEAVAASYALLDETAAPRSVDAARLTVNLRLGLMQLLHDTEAPDRDLAIYGLLEDAMQPDSFPEAMPADVRITLMQRAVDLALKLVGRQDLLDEIRAGTKMLEVESLSLTAASMSTFPSAPALTLFPVGESTSIYGYAVHLDSTTSVLLLSQASVARFFADAVDGLFHQGLAIRIQDENGRTAYAARADGQEELLSTPMSGRFAGWTLSLYPADDRLFSAAAGRQTALYIWIGTLVILLFLLSGTAAITMVSRQVKLNRLKNDFIATVSHELKTPLASMRVLMDTLFEGHYEMPGPVEEYLQMISQDNLRLTRLVDSFLTYSRMERNKHSFAIAGTDAAPVIEAAVNAVRSKLNGGNCSFEVDMPDPLSPVRADPDALALVLINLLDNACKYSSPPGDIRLRVREEERHVVFEVRDRGVGMSPRAVKRIFDKFYQVDQRLVRPVEGCGLGLSIVKYIVDAHAGSITVESRMDEGSTFTVKIPKA